MEDKVIHFGVDGYECSLIVPAYFKDAKMGQLRKVFDIMATPYMRRMNQNAVETTREMLNELLADAKVKCVEASSEYAAGYKWTKYMPHGAAVIAEKNNKKLVKNVKSAKKKHDRYVKINDLFIATLKKNNWEE